MSKASEIKENRATMTGEEYLKTHCKDTARKLSSAIDGLLENPDDTEGIRLELQRSVQVLRTAIQQSKNWESVEDLQGLMLHILKAYRDPLFSALAVIEHYVDLSDTKQ